MEEVFYLDEVPDDSDKYDPHCETTIIINDSEFDERGKLSEERIGRATLSLVKNEFLNTNNQLSFDLFSMFLFRDSLFSICKKGIARKGMFQAVERLKQIIEARGLKVYNQKHRTEITGLMFALSIFEERVTFVTPKMTYTFYLHKDGTYDIKSRDNKPSIKGNVFDQVLERDIKYTDTKPNADEIMTWFKTLAKPGRKVSPVLGSMRKVEIVDD